MKLESDKNLFPAAVIVTGALCSLAAMIIGCCKPKPNNKPPEFTLPETVIEAPAPNKGCWTEDEIPLPLPTNQELLGTDLLFPEILPAMPRKISLAKSSKRTKTLK